MPPARVALEVTVSVGVMVTSMDLVVTAAAASVTCAVKLKEPEVVGVPLRTPALLRVSPAGTVPELSDHVLAPVPPVALNDWE